MLEPPFRVGQSDAAGRFQRPTHGQARAVVDDLQLQICVFSRRPDRHTYGLGPTSNGVQDRVLDERLKYQARHSRPNSVRSYVHPQLQVVFESRALDREIVAERSQILLERRFLPLGMFERES